MSEKIYIIEQINCRGEISVDKYSFDREKFFSLLDAFKEDSFDEDGELSEEVSNKSVELFGTETWILEQLLYNMLVECVHFCDDDLTFEERIQDIKNGKYCAELEESMIAVGFSAKEAKANLIDLDEDEDW
jgi:hypothetical protein